MVVTSCGFKSLSRHQPQALIALQPAASLIDGALGIELGGHIRTANDMGRETGGLERLQQFAQGLLPGAQHDVVHLEQARLAVDRDMQTGSSMDS